MSHPDEEIMKAYREKMQDLARGLDQIFNGSSTGPDRKVCFVLLVSEFGHEGRCNYISNGERATIVTLLKEITARFEGQPEQSGTT